MAPQLDLNLVRTFVVVYETRSVTAAADVLGVSQPTVSYGLAKLRRTLGDTLFTRSPSGLTPSAEAERLYPTLCGAIAELEEALSAATEFDPTRPTRLSLGLTDLGELTVLPFVMAALTEQAPLAELRIPAFDLNDAPDQLISGEIDVIVASAVLDSTRLQRTPLFTDEYAAMIATSHPRLRTATPTVEQLAAERYVVVEAAIGHTAPLDAICAQGLKDRIALRVTRFSSLGNLVQGNELVAIAPKRMIRILAETHSVQMIEVPWPMNSVEIAAYTRPGHTATQRWFLGLIQDAMRKFPSA